MSAISSPASSSSFFYWYSDHRDLHSFPTRRSSDLFLFLLFLFSSLLSSSLLSSLLFSFSFLFFCETGRSEEHTSELQSRLHLVCRLLLEKKKHLQARLFCETQHQSVRRDRHLLLPH